MHRHFFSAWKFSSDNFPHTPNKLEALLSPYSSELPSAHFSPHTLSPIHQFLACFLASAQQLCSKNALQFELPLIWGMQDTERERERARVPARQQQSHTHTHTVEVAPRYIQTICRRLGNPMNVCLSRNSSQPCPLWRAAGDVQCETRDSFHGD